MSGHGIGGRICRPWPWCRPVRIVWMNCCSVKSRSTPVSGSGVRLAVKLTPQGPDQAVSVGVTAAAPRLGERRRRRDGDVLRVARQRALHVRRRAVRSHDQRRVAVVAEADRDEILAALHLRALAPLRTARRREAAERRRAGSNGQGLHGHGSFLGCAGLLRICVRFERSSGEQRDRFLVDERGAERRHLQGRIARGDALQQPAALRMARLDAQHGVGRLPGRRLLHRAAPTCVATAWLERRAERLAQEKPDIAAAGLRSLWQCPQLPCR